MLLFLLMEIWISIQSNLGLVQARVRIPFAAIFVDIPRADETL